MKDFVMRADDVIEEVVVLKELEMMEGAEFMDGGRCKQILTRSELECQ
jgi:hypothetical protein